MVKICITGTKDSVSMVEGHGHAALSRMQSHLLQVATYKKQQLGNDLLLSFMNLPYKILVDTDSVLLLICLEVCYF